MSGSEKQFSDKPQCLVTPGAHFKEMKWFAWSSTALISNLGFTIAGLKEDLLLSCLQVPAGPGLGSASQTPLPITPATREGAVVTVRSGVAVASLSG